MTKPRRPTTRRRAARHRRWANREARRIALGSRHVPEDVTTGYPITRQEARELLGTAEEWEPGRERAYWRGELFDDGTEVWW